VVGKCYTITQGNPIEGIRVVWAKLIVRSSSISVGKPSVITEEVSSAEARVVQGYWILASSERESPPPVQVDGREGINSDIP